jgi:hypothetical protein
MLPARASGDMRKKGTAVVTTFSVCCAKVLVDSTERNRVKKRTNRKAVDLIVLF